MLSELEARQIYANLLQLKPEIFAYGISKLGQELLIGGVSLVKFLNKSPEAVTIAEIQTQPDLWRQLIAEIRSKVGLRS